jgi:mono/diheme cytochrome c family protein
MQKAYLISTAFLMIVILSYGVVEKNTPLKRSASGLIFTQVETDSTPKKIKKDPLDADIKRLMLPVPASFSSADSARLIANWKLGMRFYKANCSQCHGIFGKGKDSIPNFSKEQVDDYKTAALALDKSNHAVMANMTMDELDAVFLFISNIKR